MPRRPRFEGETTIVLQGRRGPDATYIVLGLVWTAFVTWIVIAMLLDRMQRDQGVIGFTLLTLPVLAWALVGSLSRLRDRRPFFEADAEGLRLHPSLAPLPLAWSEIRSLSLQTVSGRRGFGGRIRVLLREPVRSTNYPFGSHEIRLRLFDLGLSYKTAADLLRQLKRLRGGPSPTTEASGRLDLDD